MGCHRVLFGFHGGFYRAYWVQRVYRALEALKAGFTGFHIGLIGFHKGYGVHRIIGYRGLHIGVYRVWRIMGFRGFHIGLHKVLWGLSDYRV